MKLFQSKKKIVIKSSNGVLVFKSRGYILLETTIHRQGFQVHNTSTISKDWMIDKRKFKRGLRTLAKRHLSHDLRLIERTQLYYRLNKDYTEDKIFHVDHYVFPKSQDLPTTYWATDSILVTFKEV